MMHLIQSYMKDLLTIIRLGAALGGTGVHIFIFCSGFGLYLSYLRSPKSYMEFLKRRFVKVYLPYVLVVLLSALIPYMYIDTDRLIAFFSHICLFKMFIPKYESSFGCQFWFISTIIQFYFIFLPLCFFKSKMSRRKFFFLSLGLSIFWWIVVSAMGNSGVRTWNSFFLQYLWEFSLGMCLAEYLREGKEIKINYIQLLIAAVIGIGLEATMALKGGTLKVFNDIPAFCGYAALTLLFYLFCTPFVRQILYEIARVSYEWFLVHILIFTTIFHFSSLQGLSGQLQIGIIALIASFIAAEIFSFLQHKSYHYFAETLRPTVYEKRKA